MLERSRTARKLALEAVVSYFPNADLAAADITATHDRQTARAFVREMRKLRREFMKRLYELNSTNYTNHT